MILVSKLELKGFNTDVQNIYFDRCPNLRKMAALKAKSLGFNLTVPLTDLSIFSDEIKALHDFMELIPSFPARSVFYISSQFAMGGSSVPDGCELAKYIKKMVQDSKVYLVTIFSNEFKDEVKSGLLDGVYGKDIIHEMPARLEILSEDERTKLEKLINDQVYLSTVDQNSTVHNRIDYKSAILAKMKSLEEIQKQTINKSFFERVFMKIKEIMID